MTEKTRGFGVPDAVDPHHFVVTVPAGTVGTIVIAEHFGVAATDDQSDVIVRCRLSRAAWRGIAEAAKRVLNDRLHEKKLKPSRWSAGNNLVERLLGKELCLLAWAVETAAPETYAAAVSAWVGLKAEERWWLFRMADQVTGTADDTDMGWRKAIRIAFTETPGLSDVRVEKRRPKPTVDGDNVQLNFFTGEDINK